jgi:ATP-dependent DNA ligase
MFKAICKLGLEGIVSKKPNARYNIKDVVEDQKSKRASGNASS